MKIFYEKEKKDIETKYANEIDKKNSLLAENEYNLQKKQSEIDEMSKNVQELSEEIEEIKKNNEAELKEVENAYLNKIEIVKIAKEEEIVEKIIPLLTP
jgi:ABC-type transporter Mla subunit MlaD